MLPDFEPLTGVICPQTEASAFSKKPRRTALVSRLAATRGMRWHRASPPGQWGRELLGGVPGGLLLGGRSWGNVPGGIFLGGDLLVGEHSWEGCSWGVPLGGNSWEDTGKGCSLGGGAPANVPGAIGGHSQGGPSCLPGQMTDWEEPSGQRCEGGQEQTACWAVLETQGLVEAITHATARPRGSAVGKTVPPFPVREVNLLRSTWSGSLLQPPWCQLLCEPWARLDGPQAVASTPFSVKRPPPSLDSTLQLQRRHPRPPPTPAPCVCVPQGGVSVLLTAAWTPEGTGDAAALQGVGRLAGAAPPDLTYTTGSDFICEERVPAADHKKGRKPLCTQPTQWVLSSPSGLGSGDSLDFCVLVKATENVSLWLRAVGLAQRSLFLDVNVVIKGGSHPHCSYWYFKAPQMFIFSPKFSV